MPTLHMQLRFCQPIKSLRYLLIGNSYLVYDQFMQFNQGHFSISTNFRHCLYSSTSVYRLLPHGYFLLPLRNLSDTKVHILYSDNKLSFPTITGTLTTNTVNTVFRLNPRIRIG